jgi:hypothetical protein
MENAVGDSGGNAEQDDFGTIHLGYLREGHAANVRKLCGSPFRNIMKRSERDRPNSRIHWKDWGRNGGGLDARRRQKNTIESVRTMIPTGKRAIPAAVEINVVPMLSDSACGSATPALPKTLKARVIPKTVPRSPNMGDNVRSEPMTIPLIKSWRFAFMELNSHL